MNQNPRMIGFGFILLAGTIFFIVMYRGRMESRSKTGETIWTQMADRLDARAGITQVIRETDVVTGLDSVMIKWDIPDAATTSIEVARGTMSGVYNFRQNIGLQTTWTDVGLDPQLSYFYRVSSMAGSVAGSALRCSKGITCDEGYSNEVVSVPIPPSPTPTASPTATATATIPPPSPTPTPTATATATIPIPDFALIISPPATRTVPSSGGSPAFSVKLNPFNGWNKSVMLSYEISPAVFPSCYIGAKLGTQPLTMNNRSCTVTISVLSDAPPGTYLITITGSSCIFPFSHSAQYTVIKTP